MMTNNNKQTNYRCKDCFFFITNYCCQLDLTVDCDKESCKLFIINPNKQSRYANDIEDSTDYNATDN